MPNFTPWYRREEYALMREIMDDGETLPLSFVEWEKNAESERAVAKREGVSIIPVLFRAAISLRSRSKAGRGIL